MFPDRANTTANVAIYFSRSPFRVYTLSDRRLKAVQLFVGCATQLFQLTKANEQATKRRGAAKGARTRHENLGIYRVHSYGGRYRKRRTSTREEWRDGVRGCVGGLTT